MNKNFEIRIIVVFIIILKQIIRVDNFSENSEFEVEHIPDGIKFDYIIVGASGSGLIAVNSILEDYVRNGEVNILLLDKGDEYREHATNEEGGEDENYIPTRKKDVNVYFSEDGYSIKESKNEGGRTSYGNVPFVAENVYSGDYYNTLGINFDMQKLQESYEYVRSVGDLIQPNIRTTWVLALERAFNDTETFPIETGTDDMFEHEYEELNSNLNDNLDYNEMDNIEGKTKEDMIQGMYARTMNLGEQKGDNSEPSLMKETENERTLYTSAYYLPYTFLTYGFRRGYKRRNGIRLIKNSDSDYGLNLIRRRGNNRLFKISNFYVRKVIFFEKDNEIWRNSNGDLTVECIEGVKLTNGKNLVESMENEDSTMKYCLKSRKGRVIITAGAINTPMILQRSGIGSVEDVNLSDPNLERPIIENKYVGKGLKDHPKLSVFGFFKGLTLNQTHIKSSNALFSRRSFGVNCIDSKEKDDIMNGCESIAISEFEGFNIYSSFKNESFEDKHLSNTDKNCSSVYNIDDECISLIRGISIHIPNPYSEGKVVWDEKNKKPVVNLGIFKDLNDLLIMEAGFRRIIRLLRSPNIYSLLVPNMISEGNIRQVTFGKNLNSTNNFLKEGIWNSKNNREYFNILNASRGREVRNIDMIYEKCNLYSLFKGDIFQEQESNIRKEYRNLEVWSGINNYLSILFNTRDLNRKKRVYDNKKEETLLSIANIEKNASKSIEESIGYLNKNPIAALDGDTWNSSIFKNTDNNYEPSIWSSVPLILPKLPAYPSMIREYVKKNTRSGNEFVGTASFGHVVRGQCFNVIGAGNLHILDESILNKHTNSDPIGTSMTLSRYAMVNIMRNRC